MNLVVYSWLLTRDEATPGIYDSLLFTFGCPSANDPAGLKRMARGFGQVMPAPRLEGVEHPVEVARQRAAESPPEAPSRRPGPRGASGPGRLRPPGGASPSPRPRRPGGAGGRSPMRRRRRRR